MPKGGGDVARKLRREGWTGAGAVTRRGVGGRGGVPREDAKTQKGKGAGVAVGAAVFHGVEKVFHAVEKSAESFPWRGKR